MALQSATASTVTIDRRVISVYCGKAAYRPSTCTVSSVPCTSVTCEYFEKLTQSW